MIRSEPDIEQALDLAQAELRSLYKRLGIQGSNILDKVDAAYDSVSKSRDRDTFQGSHVSHLEDRTGTNISIGCITPEARGLLERIMDKWKALQYHDFSKPNDPEGSHYAFAYWLVRYSGLIQPTSQSEPIHRTAQSQKTPDIEA
jgi:hypothetical protein